VTARLVFLDFDGVIMTPASSRAAPGGSKSLADAASSRMVPELVRNVSTLCEHAGADLVLSTSWRETTDEQRRELEDALRASGLGSGIRVVGQTPRLGPRGHRGTEIVAWLDAHRPGWSPADVVVLDDDGDLEPLLERWVRSDLANGFRAEHLTEALALFGVSL
jgi:Swiss Army Knife RNA repair-like protein